MTKITVMKNELKSLLDASPIATSPICQRLVPLVIRPTGTTSTGYPYFERRTFEEFRDQVPYLFATGARVLEGLKTILEVAGELELEQETVENIQRGCRVAGQMTRTAAITAPTDLWLMRHILGVHSELGLADRLVRGEAIHPEFCSIDDEDSRFLSAEQLAIDLEFLLARGVVEQYDESFRIAGHRRARQLLSELGPVPEDHPIPAAAVWKRAFDAVVAGESPQNRDIEALQRLVREVPKPRKRLEQSHWLPTVDEVRVGYRLVPLVLGLRAANLCADRQQGDGLRPDELGGPTLEVGELALQVLRAAGWVEGGEEPTITRLGARGFARAPGPFGIIQTYHPYMKQAREILIGGRGSVWVKRGENVGASQDANRHTFRRANDALDRFCQEQGFEFSVFIEHAIGRGEATRQRFMRSGEEEIRYFGADLEDAAIDAAESEQEAGRLPQNMVFVRRADIGKPRLLLDALVAQGVDPRGSVMLVGNGFHEVRDQTDATMVEVFRGYHEAGVVLLFTEENALSVDDLRATAWNTYHAGFKYVHEKSGQCLRPASPRPRPRLGPPLRAAWSECARMAGYVRADEYCARTRTIYPYPRKDRHNPSISVNHFFVPRPIAEEVGLISE